MSGRQSERQSVKLCLTDLLRDQTDQRPDSIAIMAPGRSPLTHSQLHSHIDDTVRILNALGLGRNDRIALVMPNGPEMATAFLSITSCATCAPLNPAYRENEFEFYLRDLKVNALLVQSGFDTPAITAANNLGIAVIEAVPLTGSAAGLFDLRGKPLAPSVTCGFAQPDDKALVLHTSGTTARPKIVPLTHINICTSSHNVQKAFELRPDDRFINVMPLFHGHGLMTTISSLLAGSSVIFAPDLELPAFFCWLKELRPTWYSAAPAFHQAIVQCADPYKSILCQHTLRFIRSSASPLPPRLMHDLEEVFHVPVVEGYGMTESAMHVTRNPLPPAIRKPGSVGIPCGTEIAIMNESGECLANGNIGEIVFRGDNVITGYENNPEANRSAFINGWLRSGDLGYRDEDGYLYIVGRTKEMINRGGEKISPREIDDVLMEHPEVAAAVTFAIPHLVLGEDIAVAIVLRDGSRISELDIRSFASSRLSHFKIPRKVLFLDEIPRNTIGKVQRAGLAERLGLTADDITSRATSSFALPASHVEQAIARMWTEVLKIEPIGMDDDFFLLGGTSIHVAQVIARIQGLLKVDLSFQLFFDSPTLRELSAVVDRELQQEGR